VIGGKIGQKMDEADKLKAAQALETTPTGQGASWKNPDTGAMYTMTPTRTYDAGGTPCRDFNVQAMVDGKPEQVTGTACRQADGSWKTRG
jgi:surface antigen